MQITTRALSQRIQRELAKDGRKLKKARGAYEPSVGTYFIVNEQDHIVSKKIEDLEQLGRDLGVIAEYERVAGQA
jgi:hypothetical protein